MQSLPKLLTVVTVESGHVSMRAAVRFQKGCLMIVRFAAGEEWSVKKVRFAPDNFAIK